MLRYFLVSTLVLSVVKCQGDQYLPPNKGYDYPKPNREFPAPPPTRGVPPPTYGQPPVLTKTGPVEDHHHEPGMPFDFAYAVNEDGNDYSHNAISDGDVTRGEYRVALPDGRMQIVKYTADWKTGFNAEVSYEGEAKYPEQSAQIRAGPSNQYIPPNQQPAAGGYKY